MTYPTIRPELTLDFANSRQLDPRITFSRSSSATYLNPDTGLITTASEHEARFEEEGLLMEESRTNMITYSEDLDDTSWFQFSTDVTNSVMDSPKGSSSVSFVENTAVQGSVSAQYLVFTVGNTYTFSAFVKKGNNQWVRLAHVTSGGTGCWFDLDNGEIGTVNSQGATMTAYPNGWYRITNTFIATEAGPESNVGGVPQLAFVGLSDGDGSVSASTGQNIYVWGVQMEAGSFQTSLIPTSGSTVTRAADLASITGDNFSSWYNQIQGSFFVGANHKGSSYFNNAIFLEVNNGTTNNQIKIFSVGADPYLYITDTAAVQAYIDAGSVSVGLPNKYAAGFTTNNFALSVNGATAVTDASGTNPNGITQLVIGANLSGVGQPNGHISRIAYYSRRLTDSELETLTL